MTTYPAMKFVCGSIAIVAGMIALFVSPATAQSLEKLDASVMKEQLSLQTKKPRFTPKSAVKTRTYTRNGKGAGVEIVEYATGEREERPYVAIPILFVVGTDELLDATSNENVDKTASVLRELLAGDPKAKFLIQGHSSAEGDLQKNQTLSESRAKKIHTLLVQQLAVDGNRLGQVAFGSTHASAPANSPDSELQKDRRVLVVRQ